MAIRCFKTTIAESNPQIIRQFQMDDSRSMEDFLRVILLIHGWNSDNLIHILKNNEPIEPTGSICHTIVSEEGDSQFTLQVPTMGRQEQDNALKMFLDILPQEQQDPKDDREPCLLRARGLNPSFAVGNIRYLNQLQQEMMMRGSLASSYSENMTVEHYLPDLDKINQTMKREIILHIQDIKMDYSYAEPLKKIFDSNTVANLRQMIREQEIDIHPGLRKAELIDVLYSLFNKPASWDVLLQQMNAEEYQTLEALCLGKWKGETLKMPVMEKYLLVYHSGNFWTPDAIPTELVDYYKELIIQGKAEEIRHEKMALSILEVCRKLYGIFPQQELNRVAKLLFPDEDINKLIRASWKNRKYYKILMQGVMYCTSMMQPEQAEQMYRNQEEEEIPFYHPTQEELQSLMVYGYRFPDAIQSKVVEAVQNLQRAYYYSSEHPPRIVSEIYELYHLGWNRKMIENYLDQHYNMSRNKKERDNLFRIIDANRDSIRMIRYRGLNLKEYRKIQNKKK